MAGFKVIIVGGGLTGLGLAHCLSKAGMDFVVLERNDDVISKGGASMALWPNNVRILDQLGLLKEAEQIYAPIKYKTNVRRDGSVIQQSNMFEKIQANLGHPWMCFHRPALHSFLFDSLPEKSLHVLGGKTVASIETHSNGVRVTCTDGSIHDGSIIVGADGVNSSVRRLMGLKPNESKSRFTTSYKALYGTSHLVLGLTPETLYEMHGDKCSIQVVPMPTKGMEQFLVYQRLPRSVQGSIRYSEEEKQKFAAEIADVHVTETIKFKDIFATASWSFMSGLEEGVAETWYGNRVVLIGDAVHKMTPNAGLGFNSGLQSAVVLTNGLRNLLSRSELDPDTKALSRLFREYQSIRMKNVRDTESISGLYTRVVAWDNPVWKVVDQYIAPKIGGDVALLNHVMIPLVAKQGNNMIDFLEEENFKVGRVPWQRGRRSRGVNEKGL